PRALERQIAAAGCILAGRAPDSLNERLPVPPLRWAVPLTATYESAARDMATAGPPAGTERISNGVLLVFDDALRRTDDLARLGGIGDTVEIDLVDTRVHGVPEIGVNPAFHRIEGIKTGELGVRV